MPTPTYIPLANITLGSSASTVTFSSIPATYRDLVVVFQHTGSASVADLVLQFNSDSGANYTRVVMYGNSAGTGSVAGTSQAISAVYGAKIQFGTVNIMDYSATNKHKTYLTRSGNAEQSEVGAYASRWANTAAITSILLAPNSGTLSSGSTFALYGIAS